MPGRMCPVDFDAAGNRELETGRLQLNYAPIPRLDDPEYFRHFSLSRFDGQSFSLLNYPDFERWSELFRAPADLETGYYMLVTGSRLASGSVLGNVSFFNVRPDSTTETNLTMRDNSEAVRVIGSFDSESKFTDAATGAETSVLTTAGRGYFVIGLLCVGQEPTDHALKDIAAKAAELEAWGRSLILLFPDEGAYRKYTASPAAPLPATGHLWHRPRRLGSQADSRSDAAAGERFASGLSDRRYVQPCRVRIPRLYDWPRRPSFVHHTPIMTGIYDD